MPAMATCQFNEFAQGKITHINKLLLIRYKTMYKVLPCIVYVTRAIQSCKKEPLSLRRFFRTTKFLGRHFYNHVIKSILSEAELRADEDGA